MTFENLPTDWSHRPLGDDPLTADVVDLFAREGDRERGALLFLLCDESGKLLQPMVIDGLPVEPSNELAAGLSEMFQHFPPRSLCVVAAVCLPYGRPGDTVPWSWHVQIERICRQADLPLLGSYLAVPGSVARTSLPVAA